jgi:DNA-binding NarL/FixJ family response regulator
MNEMKTVRQPSAPQKLRTKQIMIIDEDAQVRAMIRETLEPLGYAILAAGIASEGIKALDEVVIDLVIADAFMASAFNTAGGATWGIQEVRKHQSSTKVLALTGGWASTVGQTLSSAALRMGADLALPKPLNAAALEEAVLTLIGGPIEMAELSS